MIQENYVKWEKVSMLKMIFKNLVHRILGGLSIRLGSLLQVRYLKDLLNLIALLPFKHSPKALMGDSAWGGYACGKKCRVNFLTLFCCISIILSFYVDEILKACFKGDRVDIFASYFTIIDISVLLNLVFPACLYCRDF